MRDASSNAERRVVTAGFIPLLDCALLVVAHELGFAEREGVRLRLVRESSWANIRDRVALGHFDAAHMLGPMVAVSGLLAAQGGVPLVAPVALGLGGNAITVAMPLWQAMRDAGASLGAPPLAQAQALAQVIAARRRAGHEPLTLAMVFPFSCHNYQLRDWLVTAGIDPDTDVHLVVVPPPMLVEALRTGQVDGFCVGEPWNSLAVDAGLGAIVAVASDIWPEPPEKVLGLREDYLARYPDVARALVRAIVNAAHWTADAANRAELVRLLSQSRYVGAPESMLSAALECRLVSLPGMAPLERPGFIALGAGATVPRRDHARMMLERMARWRQVAATAAQLDQAEASFLQDLHAAAIAGPVSAGRARPG